MLTAVQQFSVETYIDHVRRVHDFLTGQTDLSPRNPAVNEALYGFVRDTMKMRGPEEVEAILDTPAIQRLAPGLRQLLGRAEYEMERFCARAMIGDETGAEGRFSSYNDFIYRGNYEALVAAELHALGWPVKPPPIKPACESVAFVGAGPLPISAIMFHERTDLHVTCIDSDETACRLGLKLVLHLAGTEPRYKNLDKAIRFVHKPGEEHDYATHPIVFIASLVEKKVPVVMRIVQTSHAVATTVIRSAEGLSTLLYKPEDCVEGQEEYNVYLTDKTRSSPEAINTSLVYKFPPGPENKI
jgi:hypothetical protein